MRGSSVRREVVDAGDTTVRRETAAPRDFSPLDYLFLKKQWYGRASPEGV